jgi:hypothetical protein
MDTGLVLVLQKTGSNGGEEIIKVDPVSRSFVFCACGGIGVLFNI